jgi:CheY-like chemotaxis protein
MRPLWEAGVHHVRGGVTDIDELLRVLEVPMETPPRQVAEPARQSRSGAAHVSRHTPAAGGRAIGAAGAVVVPGDEPAFQLIDGFGPPLNGRNGIRTVLLVEDEDGLRRVLKDLLEREGYHVVEATDGVHALDEIDRHAPDVVVLDLNLPRLDGYGVLSHLRARPQTAKLPVLVLTARGDEDNEERVFEYGADDFLTKPFRPRALSARLRSLLKRT